MGWVPDRFSNQCRGRHRRSAPREKPPDLLTATIILEEKLCGRAILPRLPLIQALKISGRPGSRFYFIAMPSRARLRALARPASTLPPGRSARGGRPAPAAGAGSVAARRVGARCLPAALSRAALKGRPQKSADLTRHQGCRRTAPRRRNEPPGD